MMAARASLQAGDADMAGIQADLAKKTNDFDAASHALLCLDIALAKGEVSKQEEIFQALLAEYASHPAVMLRIAKVYCQKGRWQALQLLLPKLKKKKFIAEQEYFDLLEAFAVGRLHELRAENQRKEIKAVWKLAARVQNRPAVVIAYSEALVAMQDIREAQKIVEAKLLGDWDESLILHYAALPLADKALQLAFAEDLLSSHSHSAGLFAALGIIAKQGGNYARARDYFFRSIQIAPQIACYEAMAEIATLQNDYAQANHYLRQALALTRH
jgi:HemY protein